MLTSSNQVCAEEHEELGLRQIKGGYALGR